MVEKLNSGAYKCKRCGRTIEDHKKAKKHQRLCGIDRLTSYIENSENLVGMFPENGKGKTEASTRQLSISNVVKGECVKCGSKVVSNDRFKDGTDLYECQKCGKINNFTGN
jgi:predicted RNA-binding Zn-ribbon protein involved in translation (DUF1610 family)